MCNGKGQGETHLEGVEAGLAVYELFVVVILALLVLSLPLLQLSLRFLMLPSPLLRTHAHPLLTRTQPRHARTRCSRDGCCPSLVHSRMLTLAYTIAY